MYDENHIVFLITNKNTKVEMRNWTIQRAKASDAADFMACIDRAYATYATKGIALPDVSGGIADDIRDNLVWVVVLEGRVVGGIVLIPQPDHMVLANVAVDPSATGLGLGRALMERAEQEVRTRDLAMLKLSTHVDMPENVRLYQHLGWRETGRSGNKVHMEKTLEN